jgi:uncharacterized protein (TIGR02145 family)
VNYEAKGQRIKRKTKMKYKNVILFAVILFCFGSTGLHAQTLKDNDGNVYKTVTIGTQVWMAENLKTTKYDDETAIPLVTDEKAWEALKTSAYCWYNNDIANKEIYGALYNWFAVKTNKLCPSGWHIPNDAEWTTLTTYLGGVGVAGSKLKEKGTIHWKNPNTEATNESGFTAHAGGYRNFVGTFNYSGDLGYWWCSEEYNTSNAWFRNMGNSSSNVGRYDYNKNGGFSVRCLRY